MLALGGCDSGHRSRGGPAPADATPRPSSSAPAAPAEVASPAGSQVVPERPRLLALPSGAVMRVDRVGSRPDGALSIPADIARAGWWTGSSRLADPFGSMVVAAHVDSFTQGVGPIVELLSARRGDRVTVSGARLSQRFWVRSVRLVERAALRDDAEVLSPRGPVRLVLVTCAGPYDAGQGGYRDNLVVVAVPDGRLQQR